MTNKELWDFSQFGQYATLRHVSFPGYVQIKADDEGFVVDIWDDTDEPQLVASTYATYSELQGDLDENQNQ